MVAASRGGIKVHFTTEDTNGVTATDRRSQRLPSIVVLAKVQRIAQAGLPAAIHGADRVAVFQKPLPECFILRLIKDAAEKYEAMPLEHSLGASASPCGVFALMASFVQAASGYPRQTTLNN